MGEFMTGDKPKGRIKKAIQKEPFILSHHPSCEKYSHHMVDLRGYKLCMGCFFTYPAAIITLLIAYLTPLNGYLDHIQFFGLAIIFLMLNVVRKLILRDRMSKKLHIIFRNFLGICLGLVIMGLLVIPDTDPMRWYYLILVISVAVIYNLANGIKTMRTCKACEDYPDFPKCQGLMWDAPEE